MCILFVYTDPNPQRNGYRLIIISNRDEFYIRPAQQLCRNKDVIGGRDMENGKDGGMWLGISVQQTNNFKFRFGALLNVTGEFRKFGVKGRGFIVTDYLDGQVAAEKYINSLLNSEEVYNGFNFVAVEIGINEITTKHYSNISKLCTQYDGKQTLGFGNTLPEIPLKKVLLGNERFKSIIDEYNNVDKKDELLENLLNLLKWEERHLPDPNLEKRQPVAYEYLSCVFVKLVEAGYGTRTHSIILIDYDWNMEFFEATMEEPINIKDPKWLTETIRARL